MRMGELDYANKISDQSRSIKIIGFMLLVIILFIQGDGMPRMIKETSTQISLLPLTFIFLLSMYFILSDSKKMAALASKINWIKKFSSWPSILTVAIFFLIPSFFIFVVQAKYSNAKAGYVIHPISTILVFGGDALLLYSNFFWKNGSKNSLYSFLTVIIAYLAICFLSIISFPLDTLRSDMLPIISASGKSLLNGETPYQLHMFHDGPRPLSYLPGTVFAFLPAVWLNFDLRFIGIFYVVILAWLIFQMSAEKYRRETAALLGIFILSPYFLYRHEIYTQPQWLSIVISLLLIQKNKFHIGALFLGFAVSLSQFTWPIAPFIVIFALQKNGYKVALEVSGIAAATALAIIVPFVIWSPQGFYSGVYTHWLHDQPQYPRTINLFYWIAQIIGPRHVIFVQVGAFLGIIFYSLIMKKCQTMEKCLYWMAISFSSFVLCNFVVTGGYWFFLLEFILIVYIVLSCGWSEGKTLLDKGTNPSFHYSKL